MVEFILDINLIALILASFIGFMYAFSKWSKSPGHLRQRIKDKDEEIGGWKHKFNVMNGKYSRMLKGEIVDQQTVDHISKSENVADAIPDLLNNAANFLPKQLSFIAKNPQIQGWIKNVAKDHPKEAKEFLSKYLPKIAEVATSKQESNMSRL